MDIQALKTCIQDVMPILDANLNAANAEWMRGEIARGALEYCLSRHHTALTVLQEDNLDPERAYTACAPLTMDLRSGIKDVEGTQTGVEWAKKLDGWWICFQQAGFTEVNTWFNIPILPEHNNQRGDQNEGT